MEGKLGDLYVDIIAKSEKLKEQLNKTTKDIEMQGTKMSNSFASSFTKGLNVLFTGAVFYKVVDFFKKSIDAINAQSDAEAELRQQLGYTSQALHDQASALQLVTKFSDEDIIATQARIAAFTKDEEKIKLLTKATLDFAAAKKTDLTTAGDLLAKTIGGEINALGRYGIKVDGAAGSTERLMQVVEGVASLYNGQAEAAGRTFSGRLTILKNKVGELEEGIGKALVPTLEKIVNVFGNVADSTQKTSGFFQGVAVAGRILGSVFIVVKTTLVHIGSLLGTVGAALYALINLRIGLLPGIIKSGFDTIKGNAKGMIDDIYKMWDDLDKKMAEEPVSKKPRYKPKSSGDLTDDEKKAYKAKFDAELKYQEAQDALIQASIKDRNEAERQAIEDRLNLEIASIKKRILTEGLSKEAADKEIAAANLRAQADLMNLLREQDKYKEEELQRVHKLKIEQEKEWQEMYDNYFAKRREEEEEIRKANLQSISELGYALQGAFGKTGDDFISKLNQALQVAIRIAETIKAAETAKGFSGVLGVVSSVLGVFGLFGAQGGSFQNGRKIAAFAGGGSMIVPYMGLSGDAYPIMVKGGERVDVTPNYKVGQNEKILSELVDRVEALTLATIRGNNKQIRIPLYLNEKLVAEAVTKVQNAFGRDNIKMRR